LARPAGTQADWRSGDLSLRVIRLVRRLYVRPQARGRNVGRQLAERLIAEARKIGYKEMRLDVQEKSVSARRLYEALGFVTAEPISFNPVSGASFLGRHL
jgi:putative acetyltransferase